MQVTNKKDVPNELTVRIEKMSNLGLGIAKFEGYVIFVENACVDDVLKIKLTKKNKTFANAEILDIITPSHHRVAPFCKMQKICGACQLQYIDYDFQLDLKKQIVSDTMYSIYGDAVEIKDVIPSPLNREYRHKIQYPVKETKDSKRIVAGYYKPKSHELVNIKYCPIQPEYCDGIIEFIRETAPKYNISGYDEKLHKGLLRHIVVRASYANQKALVTLVINSEKLNDNVISFAKEIYKSLSNIAGVAVNLNNKKTNLILDKHTEIVAGEGFVEEALCDKIFKIGAKTFFQVNPVAADSIFRYIKSYIQENYRKPAILDAYAGITAFGICMSDIASKVVSIEEEPESVKLAETIIKENNIDNIELHCGDAGDFFADQTSLGRLFDITILDPPRKGCSQNSLDYAMKLTRSKIIYVSCNPATLARDLKYMKQFGAKVEYIQPFDMFPHTYHIESVAIIDLQNLQENL